MNSLKKLIIFIFLLTLTFINANYIAATSPYLYDANKNKDFESAEKYFPKIDKKQYAEYPNSTLNYKGIILYKDIGKSLQKEAKRFHIITNDDHSNPNISPERQVYLFYSARLMENNNRIEYRFIIIDAETEDIIAEGSGDGLYSPD